MKKVLILGAGLSGLSLAYRLSKKDFSITLLEKRETYQNDRTWCFWNTSSHPFEDLIDYRWNKWQVNHKGRSKVCTSSAYEYQMISAETFYRELIARLKSQGNVDICLGVEVKDIVKQEKSFEAITSKGFFLADSVYDSRPNVMTSLLYQHFHGWHIQIDRPLFDPSKVILMDFDVDQSKGIHFMYVLPFSPFEALVEPTFLSESPLEKSAYESSLDAYLSSRYGIKAFKIIREEKGVLPLATHFKTSFVPDLKYIGSAGGWMRSSTGYAFLSIQEAIERH
ncbi:MAG: lycopene cyclase family protein, partial [Parachlamydiaceae bacterium]